MILGGFIIDIINQYKTKANALSIRAYTSKLRFSVGAKKPAQGGHWEFL